jgi:predicted phosphodiesterase
MDTQLEAKIRRNILNRMSIAEIVRKNGVSKSSVYRIKKKMAIASQEKEVTPNIRPDDPLVRSDAMRFIRKNRSGFTVSTLGKKLNISEKDALAVIQHLSHHDGYNLIHHGDTWNLEKEIKPIKPLSVKILLGKGYSFGVISDNHLCSKYARLDVLEAAYDIFQKRGIKHVINAGNMIDGEFRFNRYELLAHGAHDQSLYFADHYPQRSGITTYFVTGDCHEGWWQAREGIKMGWYLENVCNDNGRKDIKFLGHVEQDIILKQKINSTRIRVMHPGGGTPYALSYPSQKMVESFQGGDKPHILIMGHFHKFDFNWQREVMCLMPGCTQDQTPFMRKKKLAAHVGFCIVNMGARLDGTVGACGVEWFPFYDRGYHQKINDYTLTE